jgi:hypothetical protein
MIKNEPNCALKQRLTGRKEFARQKKYAKSIDGTGATLTKS